MEKEREVKILEIDEEKFIEKIMKCGAVKVDEFLQRRFVYDLNPINPNKWIRLRTNGKRTTLTIKEIKDKNRIDGTEELEMTVEDFDRANEILNQLGYFHRNYQENYRKVYLLDGVEISIDSWPLIPSYVEIEGKTNDDVLNVLRLIGEYGNEITFDVDTIYKDIYGIDMKKIKELRLR